MVEAVVPGPAATGAEKIASVYFGDIEEGTGYVSYFLNADEDSVGVEYGLGRSTVYSHDLVISATSTTTFTFNSATFNLPRTALGTAIVNFAIACKETGSPRTVTPSIKLYHVNSGGATQLGSTWTGPTITCTSPNATVETHIAKIVIASAQKFKKGDWIRVEIILTHAGGGSGSGKVGCDPQNRESGDLTAANGAFTSSVLLMPFRIF